MDARGDETVRGDQDGLFGLIPTLLSGFLICTKASAACCLVGMLLPCLLGIFTGMSLLIYVATVRHLTPTWSHFSVPLYFDYRHEAAVAYASFQKFQTPVTKSDSGIVARLVEPGEKVDIAVELVVPDSDEIKELFHLSMDLLDHNKSVLLSTSRPHLLQAQEGLFGTFQSVVLFPFKMMGVWEDRGEIMLDMFSLYVDELDRPLSGVKAVLEARHGGSLPKVGEAKVHVGRNQGFIGHVLFLLRPSGVPTAVLITVGILCIVMCCSCACIPGFVLLNIILTRNESPVQPVHATVVEGDDNEAGNDTSDEVKRQSTRKAGGGVQGVEHIDTSGFDSASSHMSNEGITATVDTAESSGPNLRQRKPHLV